MNLLYEGAMEGFDRFFLPKFFDYNGYIFVDISKRHFEEIVDQIRTHESVPTAQKYMNVCLVEHWIDKIIGEDWDLNDERANAILEAIICLWAQRLKLEFPDSNAQVLRYKDEEYGDFGLTVLNGYYGDEGAL